MDSTKPTGRPGEIAFVYKQDTPLGRWTSVPHYAPDLYAVRRGVHAGWEPGQPRWAESPDGRFLCGVADNGLDTLSAAPPMPARIHPLAA